jgi:adhesin transport system outer membrane protein
VNTAGWHAARARGFLLAILVGGWTSVWAAPPAVVSAGSVKCRSELSPEALDRAAGRGTEMNPEVQTEGQMDPVEALRTVARQAMARSAMVGASKLLTEAAAYDLDQIDASKWPQLSVSGGLGPQHSSVNGQTSSRGTLTSLGMSASLTLYDAGRLREQSAWRKELLRAENLGLQQAGEAVVSEVVSATLDRNRYQMQAQVYQQYVRKMQCLLEALEVIVAADKGRASEMVQARKTLAQAELSRDIAAAAGRQVDYKLKKLLGDNALPSAKFTTALAATPDLGEVRRRLDQSADLQQVQAQIQASENYARSMESSRWPQVGLSAGSSLSHVSGISTRSWQTLVSVSYNLFDGGLMKAASDSAWTRAQASRQQYEELVNSRVERVLSLHDTSTTAFKHAKRYAEILRDSEQVRAYTFLQWSQLGRRSLFDLMSAESEHFSLRVSYVNALFDGYQANAQLRSLGGGIWRWIGDDGVR